MAMMEQLEAMEAQLHRIESRLDALTVALKRRGRWLKATTVLSALALLALILSMF